MLTNLQKAPFTAGHLTGGMANQHADGHQQHRERLWASPNCQPAITPPEPHPTLWDLA